MTAMVIEAALRSLVLALAVWTALRLLRVRNVLAEKTAWILVLAAAVAMPLLLMVEARWPALPAPKLVLPAFARHQPVQEPVRAPAQTAEAAAAKPAPASAGMAQPAVAETHVDRAQHPSFPHFPVNGLSGLPPHFISKTVDPAALDAAKPAPAKTSAPRRLSLAALALVTYLLIAGALCLRLLLGLAVTLRVWRGAVPVPALKLDPAEGLRLRASDQITAPVTFASGVLLPAEYSDWGEEKLRIVLAHERSHVRQGDFYLQLLASLYAAVLWLSPLGWWLKRKLSDLGEAIGDRSGLKEAASRTSYARVLLEFAATPRPTLIGVAMARPSSLSRRLERLLNDSAFYHAFSSRRRAFAAALLLPAIFFAAVALVRVEAASDSAVQTAKASQIQKAEAQEQRAHVQELAADEAMRKAEAAQESAEAQVRSADTQEMAADEAARSAEAAQESAEAEAQAAARAVDAVPAVSSPPFDPPAIRMEAPNGQQVRVPDGVRTVILMDSPSPSGQASSYAYSPAGETFALLTGVHAGVHAAVSSSDSVAEATFDRSLSFSGKLELHVATGCGNVHLTRGGEGQLVIHGHVHSNQAEEADEVRSIAANPPIEQEGNIIHIGAQHEEHRNNHICIDYEVQAAADAALDAISGSGDIVDEGVGQGAKLMSGSGDITATGLTGGFTSQTGSGNISIDNGGEGEAKAQTGSGNIDVKGVHGSFRAQTGSGDIKAEGTPSSAWKLETGSGSIEFSPGSAALTLDASTGSGTISSDTAVEAQTSEDHHHLRADLHGGGPEVRLETGSGDIRIHD
jgi:hypothetical protein